MLPDRLRETLAQLPEEALREPRRSLRATLAAPPAGQHRPRAAGQEGELERPPLLDTLPRVSLDERPTAAASRTEVADGERVLADLRVIAPLGEGGMGRVVLAEQRSMRRRVAVKIAHQIGNATEGLIHEGVISGMLEHPNIPPVHALARDAEGRATLVMKHIEGVTWADVLASERHPLRAHSPLFSGRDALTANLEILVQLTNALELAHARGAVHRDVKPSNVMLGRYGEVYLIDWGIAFYASWPDAGQAELVGTAVYMAPEMVTGEPPDARTDVYLLGATLLEVLTGKPPHDAPDLASALLHAVESPPPALRPDVPAELAALCVRSLARLPSERPESVAVFRDGLRAFLAHRSAIALTASAEARIEDLERALVATPDAAEVSALHDECRFALRQALREWPENEKAKMALSRLAQRMAEHELARDNPRGARALLAEVPAPAPALLQAIDRAEAARARRQDEARGLDLRRGRAERTFTLGLMSLTGLGFLAWRLWEGGGQSLRARHLTLFVVWLVPTGLILLAPLAAGRFREAASKSWRGFLMSIVLAVLLHRLVGVFQLPGAAPTIAGDLSIALGVALFGGFLVDRRLARLALPLLAGLAVVLLAPTRPEPVFATTMLALLAGVYWVSRGGPAQPT